MKLESRWWGVHGGGGARFIGSCIGVSGGCVRQWKVKINDGCGCSWMMVVFGVVLMVVD